jgi:hypothetical protein
MGMYGSAGIFEEADCPLSWGETLGLTALPKSTAKARRNRKSRRSRKARRSH